MAKVNFSMFPIHRIFPDNYPSACYQLLNLSSTFTAALLRPSRPKPAARSGYKTAGYIKVIYTKCYKNPMNLVPFCFCADRAIFGWNCCNSAKVSYLAVFSCFHGQKKYKIRVSAHCTVRAIILIIIMSGKKFFFALKCIILALKYTRFGQNRLNIYNQY